MKLALIASLCWMAALTATAETAAVVILGEYHDNPAHHARQAERIAAIGPTAVVYEMLLPDEAERLDAAPRTPTAMRAAMAGMHWPGLEAYVDLFVTSPRIKGAAVPRDRVRAAFEAGAASVFGPEAQRFGLTDPLPDRERAQREAHQFDAHCGAMPRALMPGLVEAQRLRDAEFARRLLETLDAHGAPVVFVTGNGHARRDWGVPAYLARVAPEVTVHAVGQGEGDQPPEGLFDEVVFSDPPEREDPCAGIAAAAGD